MQTHQYVFQSVKKKTELEFGHFGSQVCHPPRALIALKVSISGAARDSIFILLWLGALLFTSSSAFAKCLQNKLEQIFPHQGNAF